MSVLRIRIGFNIDPVLDPDPGFFDDRKLQKFYYWKMKYKMSKNGVFYPKAHIKDVQAKGEASMRIRIQTKIYLDPDLDP